MRSETKRPNIVFFFTDQQRADTCGCMGSALGLTPNLDALASDGVAFQNAITCQPVCGPARACIQTGRYATDTGCFRNAIAIRDDGRTIARQLTRAGYSANYIGKWHLALTEREPVPREKRCGYDGEWIASDLLEFTSDACEGYLFDRDDRKVSFSGEYRSDVLTRYAVDFIGRYAEPEPFFLMISYLEPHHQNHRNRYVAPEGYADACRHLPPPKDLVALDWPEADWRQNLADYYGCIKRLDENLGEIVAALKAKGIDGDTVIVFTSDHGSHFRTRNSEYKRSGHEASVHIPLVIRGGAYSGGRSVETPVSLLDVPTSVLRAAGVTPDAQMVGRDLAALSGGTDDGWDDAVYIQISESQVGRALRTGRYKYGVTAPGKDGWNEPSAENYVSEYLYDLADDPYELANRVNDPAFADVQRSLRERLLEKMAGAGERGARIDA